MRMRNNAKRDVGRRSLQTVWDSSTLYYARFGQATLQFPRKSHETASSNTLSIHVPSPQVLFSGCGRSLLAPSMRTPLSMPLTGDRQINSSDPPPAISLYNHLDPFVSRPLTLLSRISCPYKAKGTGDSYGAGLARNPGSVNANLNGCSPVD